MPNSIHPLSKHKGRLFVFEGSDGVGKSSISAKVADQLEWPDTFDAEYIALTQLQADAFITLDGDLASAVKDLVVLAPFDVLSQSERSLG